MTRWLASRQRSRRKKIVRPTKQSGKKKSFQFGRVRSMSRGKMRKGRDAAGGTTALSSDNADAKQRHRSPARTLAVVRERAASLASTITEADTDGSRTTRRRYWPRGRGRLKRAAAAEEEGFQVRGARSNELRGRRDRIGLRGRAAAGRAVFDGGERGHSRRNRVAAVTPATSTIVLPA